MKSPFRCAAGPRLPICSISDAWRRDGSAAGNRQFLDIRRGYPARVPSLARRLLLPWLLTAALLFAFWLLLVDTREEAQIYAGIGVALLGAAGSELVRGQRIAQVRPRPRMLARSWRPLAKVPRDLLLLARAVAPALRGSPPQGRLRALPFEPGGEDPVDNARRAAAELGGSFAPNTVVIGVDGRRKAILVHQLVPDTDDPESSIDPLGVRWREPGEGA
jgi:hypothetical protein